MVHLQVKTLPELDNPMNRQTKDHLVLILIANDKATNRLPLIFHRIHRKKPDVWCWYCSYLTMP